MFAQHGAAKRRDHAEVFGFLQRRRAPWRGHVEAARGAVRRQFDRQRRRLGDGADRQRQAAARFDIAPFGAGDEGGGDGVDVAAFCISS